MKLYKIYDRDMPETDIENQTIVYLANKCLAARKAAEEARQAQIELENELLSLPAVRQSLKDSGTTTFLGGFFKVLNKLNKKWDQDQLVTIIQSNEWPIMPFDIEYKPNAARMKTLEDTYPEAYRKLSAALTETPAKPYFSFKE